MTDVLRFSEQTDKLFPAFKKALDEMGTLKKNAANPHFKSKYADLTAVFDTTDDALSKHGLFHIEGQGGRVVEGQHYALIVTRIIHAESGQWVENEMLLPLSKQDPQGAGSAYTYGRRYTVQGLCGLAAEDDDGNGAASRNQQQNNAPPERPKVIDAQKRAMFNALTAQLPPAEVEAIVCKAQEHYGSLPTGKVEDLYEGEESRSAYGLMQKAVRELTGAAKK